MIQRSEFFMAKIQGASGLALAPYELFSVVALLASCLVSGLAVVVAVGACCSFLVGVAGCWLACRLSSERSVRNLPEITTWVNDPLIKKNR